MSTAILIGMLLITLFFGFRSRGGLLGLWVFVLMTHGMFVYFFGEGLRHLPMYMGFIVISLLVINGGNYQLSKGSLILVLSFLFTILISFLVNEGDASSINKIIMYAKPMLVCLVVAGYIKGFKDVDSIAFYIILAATIGSIFNIYQQVYGIQLSANEWDSSLSRAAGLRGDPNDTAMLLGMATPFVYFKYINGNKKNHKLFYGLCAALIVIGIVLTGSRAGFLVMAGIAGAIMIHKPKASRLKIFNWPTPRNIMIIFVLLVMAVFLAPKYYWERMATLISGEEMGASQSLYSRGYLLQKGFGIWLSNPIIGVGPGKFHEAMYGDQVVKIEAKKQAVAHNMYIEFLAEFGIVGFIAFMGIVTLSIRRLLRLDKYLYRTSSYEHIGYMTALSLLSMLVFGFTLSQGYNSVMWFIIAIGISSGNWISAELRRRKHTIK